jgi:TetR/AcrR family tetracycline transcriptional repressor
MSTAKTSSPVAIDGHIPSTCVRVHFIVSMSRAEVRRDARHTRSQAPTRAGSAGGPRVGGVCAERTPSRAEWGSLSRDAVIGTATALLEADGVLSVRAVAARLGVSPMALYRHVRNKDDLLDEVVDRLFADRWRPARDDEDWRQWIIDAADRLRRFLVDVPAALQVYLSHPVVAPTAAQRMDACLDVLARALGDDARARRAYAAIQTYTIGFAALEAAREEAPRPGDGRGAPAPVGHDADRARELASYSSPTQFLAGLGYLLAGIG